MKQKSINIYLLKMKLRNEEILNEEDLSELQAKFKKIKNTVVNLKKVNYFLFKNILLTYRVMILFFFLLIKILFL